MPQLVQRVPAHGCPRKVAQQVSSTRREQDSSARRQHRGAHCKAQSAMQSPQVAPQTRSTATALVVALREKHNLGYAKLPLRQAKRTDA
jgi:hypothetical protein